EDRVGAAGIDLVDHVAIDVRAVDADVRGEFIDQYVAVHRHPDPAVGAAAAVPEHLELEPLIEGDRDRGGFHPPAFHPRTGAVGHVVGPDHPAGRSTVVDDLYDHAEIVDRLPFVDHVPAATRISRQLAEKVRLQLPPEADVHVARLGRVM